MAQLIISAAGAAVGAMFGQPALGWAIGSYIGGSMFGPKAATIHQGSQPLMDLRVTGSEYGQCIPYVRGSAGIAGQMWWNTDRRATTTVTSSGGGGGKGGGGGGSGSPVVETSTTTYDMDCLIGLTDNQIAGIARVWSNGALIYTASSGATADSIAASEVANAWTRLTVYTGASDQLPDPTYEAAVGAAEAPAYRGRGSVFIEGLKLGTSGQIPNLVFEVVADGTMTAPNTGVLLHFDENPPIDSMGIATVTINDGGGANAATTTDPLYGDGSFQNDNGASDTGIVDLTAITFPPAGAAFCLEAWFMYDAADAANANYSYILSPDVSVAFQLTYDVDTDQADMLVSLSSDGVTPDIWSHTYSAVTKPVVGTYFHMALDYDGVTYRLYLNGTQIGSQASATHIFAQTELQIVANSSSAATSSFIDEFRYSTASRYPDGTPFTPTGPF